MLPGMQGTSAAGDTRSASADQTTTGFVWGLVPGIAGFVLGGLVFGFLALTWPHTPPGDRVAGALGIAWLLDVIPTLLLPVVGIRWLRRGRRRRGLGVLVGVATGLALTVAASTTILWIIQGWSGTCPCDPPPVQLW